MPATWPAGISSRLRREGVAFDPGEAVIRTNTDSGLARQRAAVTAVKPQWSGNLAMTDAQVLTFVAWRAGLKGSTFTWPEPPLTGSNVEARFVAGKQGLPAPDPKGVRWLVPVCIELMA